MTKNCKNGFTLAELLIVVAIIAVLVAISIPIFTGQLEKAKQATDLANMRSAKAAAVADYMTDGMGTEYKKYYDASKGSMSETAPEGYGKSSTNASEFASVLNASGVPNKNGKANYITVIIYPSGQMEMTWGTSYGTFYRNNVLAVGNSEENNWATNKDLKAIIKNIDNSTRVEQDKDILNAFADYFENLSASEVKTILGDKKYNDSKRGNSQLFAYSIDNNSASIRIDYPGNDVSYLSDLGYSTINTSGQPMKDGLKVNYKSEYLFSSDDMIGPDILTGREHSIRIHLDIDESTNTVTHARVWVNGVSDLDSDLD